MYSREALGDQLTLEQKPERVEESHVDVGGKLRMEGTAGYRPSGGGMSSGSCVATAA